MMNKNLVILLFSILMIVLSVIIILGVVEITAVVNWMKLFASRITP